MVDIIGLNAKLDRDRFKNTYSKNSGKDITTEGIKKGWETLQNDFEDDFIENLKKSPYYLKVEYEYK